MKSFLFFLMVFSSASQAEQYACTYVWEGQKDSNPILIDVQGDKAVIKGGVTTPTYDVVSNTETELLLYRIFTKETSGSNYPVGFTVMALDKKTKSLSRSNTFSPNKYNSHAFGKCGKV